MSENLSRLEANRKKRSAKKELRSWIFCLIGAVMIALFLRFFVFEFVRVDGESMTPTLQSEEFVFVEKVSRYFNGIDRGDIVITHYPNRKDSYVKRVVAVGGDTVAVKDGYLYINGEKQEEPYIKEPIRYTMSDYVVPKGYYFVLGDNRNDSMDSHVSYIGPVSEDLIVGHAVFVIWPFSQIEWLTY